MQKKKKNHNSFPLFSLKISNFLCISIRTEANKKDEEENKRQIVVEAYTGLKRLFKFSISHFSCPFYINTSISFTFQNCRYAFIIRIPIAFHIL